MSFLAGLAMGIVFSVLGAGGGIISVPVLLALFDIGLTEATAGGLGVVWAAALTGAVGHARAGRVRWREVGLVGLPSMAGALAGTRLHGLVPDRITMLLFSVVLLAATLAFLRPRRAEPEGGSPAPVPVLVTVGLGLGVLTGFLGVGGGFLIVPALVLLARLPLKHAVGTSLAVIVAGSFSGTMGYLWAGQAPIALVLPVAAGAVLGALVGAPLAGRLPERPQRIAFAVLALSVAAGMAWNSRSA